jgi:hypothetical protein
MLAAVGAVVLVIMAMFTMGQLAESSSGERTKLALRIKEKYRFANVSTDPASPDLYFEVTVHDPGDAPDEDPTRERVARKYFTDGRRLAGEFRDPEAQKCFDQLATYPETDAFADYQMWEIACFAINAYEAPDRNKVETIRILRRVTYGTGPAAQTREKTMEPMKVPKKVVESKPATGERREIKRE